MLISVYETNPDNRQKLKELLVSYSIRYNKEFDLLWITESGAVEKSKNYLLSSSICFISLDSDGAEEYANSVYSENPDMRICYYKNDSYDISYLLNTRPIAFYLFNENAEVFYNKVNCIFGDILSSRDFFCYATRTCIYCYPNRNITYISSDLKYVLIHKQNGNVDRIYAKLVDIEKKLNISFIRIHKSYLVNPLYVCRIDKHLHTVELINGDTLSISDPYYQSVIDYFI